MISINADIKFVWLPTDQIFTPSYDHMNYKRLQEYYLLLVEHPEEHNHPVLVIPAGDRYKLLDGRHKHLAAVMAKRKTTPALILAHNY